MDFLEYLKKVTGGRRVSVERVVSGPGIVNIYQFLRQHWAFIELKNKKIDDEITSTPEYDQARIIVKGAKEGDLVCKKAIDIFCVNYGSELGVAALKWLPYGGLYISGGIAAKNPDWVKSDAFQSTYKDKGRLSPLVESIPLYLVTVEDTGERGALFVAVRLLLA